MSGKRIDVYKLSDQTLARTLHEFGATCGPIVDQTRDVYRRKLLSLMDSRERSMTGDMPDLDTEDIEEMNPDENIKASSYKAGVRGESGNRKTVMKEQPRQRLNQPTSTPGRSSLNDSRSVSGGSSQLIREPAKKPMMLLAVVVAVVVLLIFLIVYNMESAYSPPALASNVDNDMG